MFVTTAGRTNEAMITRAKGIADELQINFVHREKRSVDSLQRMMSDDCIVVGKERLELYRFGIEEPFFFHPNSSMFRIKRLLDGEHDPFVEACQLKEGKKFLDCTLGLGSDSIVASFMVGDNGKVVGVEGNPYIAYLTRAGLKSWSSHFGELKGALERLEVITAISYDYIKMLPAKSFDTVYFDPMFDENIVESDGIKALTKLALYEDLTEELIHQAKRVARERIVLKDHFRSKRFEQYQFRVKRRKTSKFHFGILEIQ